MKAVVMTQAGGCDVMKYVDFPEQNPGAGEALIEVSAAGVNFMDIGVRRGGAWQDVANPKRLGVEGAGRVLAIGEGVQGVSPGQRVAWVYAPGSYAQRIVIPTSALVPIPDEIDDLTAASVMMQGLTASHFTSDFYPVQPGDIALVHAAAGGLGLLLTQMIKLRGGYVIGRVSSTDKVAIAKQAGADHVIVDTQGSFAKQVIHLSGGEGVHIVYDGSGPKTFQGSLDSLRISGTLCWYGPVLGGPDPIDIMSLPLSIKIGYAVFLHHIPTAELLRSRAAKLFDMILAGQLNVRVGAQYSLADAANAHLAMESRTTTGKLLLIP
ncbi:quinone oxidoreductase family protein [Pseudomonas sp. EL_65y_Pfl2_R95]|uniref:quinone oxidoreductase family protein n=1 Tax=Pseudomonas sp. EL_65y_Pfl2_R95 TaxID=3088698 RepID=UPI0030D8BC72